jgi:hypothetical protein
MQNRGRKAAARAAILGVTLILAGCGAKGPAPIDPNSDWVNYSEGRVGYSFKYPANYNLVPSGNGEIAVRGKDHRIAFRVCFVTEAEAKKRGLWVTTEPLDELNLSNHTVRRYVYDHWDGPTYSHTVAYVATLDTGKMIGLEFCLDRSNTPGRLDEGQTKVLESFTIF